MALSSANISAFRDRSPSRSPLSPTIIHYRQKYQIPKISHHHHHHRKQQHQNRRTNNSTTRQQSHLNSLWEVHKSSNGQIYYYNVVTDQSQWEKPPKEQFSSSIKKKSIHSKRSSNNNNDLFLNNQYHSKKSKRPTSSSTFSSHNDVDSFRFRSSNIHHRSFNNIDRTKIETITTNNRHHHKRRKDTIETKSSIKRVRKDKREIDKIELSTPISPPANEKIQIDLVDPIPTPSNSINNISIPSTVSQHPQSDSQVPLIYLDQMKVKSSDSKQSIKRQINEDLPSTVIQSSLYPSESTINAILQLEHSSPIESTTTNSHSDHIKRYYRAELIEHLLNWPSTQIEREAIRLSNEQIRYTTYQLTSLRTDLFSIRLRLQQNHFHLVKYRYILINQEDLLDKLQFIESDQI